MADIFMSYASEDRDRARVLAEALESRSWTVWWDREIPIGKAYTDVIEHELMTAGCVIVLWSEESVKSQWVCNEAREGYSRHVLVPVLIDDVRPPLEFRHLQTASLVDWEPGSDSRELAKVESAIRAFSRKEGAPAPAPVSASVVDRSPRTDRRAFVATLGGMGVLAVLIALWLTCWRERGPTTETSGSSATTDATTAPVSETTTTPETAPATETTMTVTTPEPPTDILASRDPIALSGLESVVAGIGSVVVDGREDCTAFLVSRRYALTLRSCVTQTANKTLVLRLGETAALNAPATDYPIRVIESQPGNPSSSFVLLELATPADRKFTPIRFHRRKANVAEKVLVPIPYDPPHDYDLARIRDVRSDVITYDLTTRPASKGAPVIALSDYAVVGVHVGRDGRHPTLKRAVPAMSIPDSIIAKIH